MTNSADYPGYVDLANNSGTDWSSWGGDDSADRKSRVGRALWLMVAVLGVVIFAVSACSPVALGVPVQLGVPAAIVAAVGLSPRDAGHGWVVVTLAGSGFLATADTWVRTDNAHWSLTAIMVVNALQALAAIGALICDRGMRSATVDEGGQHYSTSDEYTQAYHAYQAYATQYLQSAPAYYEAAGQATGSAQQAGVRADVTQETFGSLQARYGEYGDWASADGVPSAPPVAPVAERDAPGVRPATPPSRQYRVEAGGSADVGHEGYTSI